MTRFFDSIRQVGFRRGPSRIVGGICGGLADKAGISVTLVRVLVLLSFLLPVVGLGAYLVAWILTPWQNGSIPLERFIDRLSGRDTL
ncbi:PspC domain-containing protein [Ruania alba]|uniref:Phage shock protein PspC (Stress-responsive transcriptional regulator) n=1 Tax=Ruania alba TaxID=648782 RepID=A0A1H5EBL7_9MICO|nr:PspC domain-containing protein [Ruania alba]SED88456.1 Phage shock protein PspC (stress-responsive transcriptional regulator) [Ruania alba]